MIASALAIIGAVLGGGTFGVVAKSVRDAYVARLRREEHAERTRARAETREDDTLGRIAIEDRDDRRRMEQLVGRLQDEVRVLSVQVARCEERHAVAEERERSLTNELLLTRQLADRQRAEIDALRSSIADITKRFDALVERRMTGADSVPPGATTA